MLRKDVLSIFIVLCATCAFGGGAFKIEKPDKRVAGKHPKASVEIYAKDEKGDLKRVLKAADKELKAPLKLPEGEYVVYVEDEDTGHIARFDGDGKGLRLGKEDVTLDLDAFYGEVEAIIQKDKAEKRTKAQAEPKNKKKSTLAVGGPPGLPGGDISKLRAETMAKSLEGAQPAPPAMSPLQPKEPDTEYNPAAVPGTTDPEAEPVDEVMVRYGPAAGLYEKYSFMTEISAEARSKLNPLEIYRLKLPATIAAAAVVKGYADDPRISWVEPNLTLSIPDPVEGESAREKPEP